MKIGLFADNHESRVENIIARSMKENEVDLIISLGDLIEVSRPGKLIKIMDEFCKTGIPFYSMPGNHETYRSWREACEHISGRYPNFIDASKDKIYTFQEVPLVFIPGSERLSGPYGFKIALQKNKKVTNPRTLEEQIKEQGIDPSKILLFCHDPPLQKGEHGTDVAVQARHKVGGYVVFGMGTKEVLETGDYEKVLDHKGSEFVKEFVDSLDINFVFSGHIHEGIGGVTKEGRKVEQGVYSPSLFLNPGPAGNGVYAIVTFDKLEDKLLAKYEIKALFGKTGYEEL